MDILSDFFPFPLRKMDLSKANLTLDQRKWLGKAIVSCLFNVPALNEKYNLAKWALYKYRDRILSNTFYEKAGCPPLISDDILLDIEQELTSGPLKGSVKIIREKVNKINRDLLSENDGISFSQVKDLCERKILKY